LNNNTDDPGEIARELAEGAEAELVQVIGRTIVLYKESKDHKTIVLP
jgi:RNA-binding protein